MKETRQATVVSTVVSQKCLGCGKEIPRSKKVHFCERCDAKRGNGSGIRVVGQSNDHRRIIKKIDLI